MRIGILYDPNHPHVKNWANAIKQTGHEVFVFSLIKGNIKNIPTITIGNYKNVKYLHYLLSANKLKKKLIEYKIDILHPIHLTPYGTWGRLTNFKPIIPMAIGLDVLNFLIGKPNNKIFWENSKTNIPIPQKIKNKLLFNYYKTQITKNIIQADFVIADGQYLIEIMQSLNLKPANKFKTIHWGVRPELYKYNPELQKQLQEKYKIPVEKNIILSPRGVAPVYNPLLVLNTAKILLPDIPENYVFIVLTNGYPIDKDAIPIINELQIKFPNKFLFVKERLTPELMAQLWLKTKIFISVPYEDGLPVSLIEAFYVGAIPVISFLPSYKEAITGIHKNLIIGKKSPEELKQKILYAINLPENEKKQIISYGKEWTNKNGIIYHNAQKFVELCKKLI